MDNEPIREKDYKFKEKTVRFEGMGKHTGDYMFRDIISGAYIFVSPRDLNKLQEK